MVARTVIESVTGTLFAISATLPDTYDSTGYSSTDIIWTTVGQIEDAGSEDATKAVTPFVPVATATTTKVPGAIDFGKRSVMLGHLPGDAGQVILQAAFKDTSGHYSVKITFPDGELRYLDVLVTKFGMQGGKVGEVHRITSEIDICRAPVTILP